MYDAFVNHLTVAPAMPPADRNRGFRLRRLGFAHFAPMNTKVVFVILLLYKEIKQNGATRLSVQTNTNLPPRCMYPDSLCCG